MDDIEEKFRNVRYEEIERLKAEIEALRKRPIQLGGVSISEMQAKVSEWKKRNYPDESVFKALAVLSEEVGELCHAIIKGVEGERYLPLIAKAKTVDAIGDIFFALLGVCHATEIDAEATIATVVSAVLKRTRKGTQDANPV